MPSSEIQSPTLRPPRRAALPFFGLWWLSLLRLVRAWRWRAVLLVCLVGAYVLDSGDSFGAGAAVAFPGGGLGVQIFAIFLTASALVLGLDLVGQLDRHFARRAFDARPLPALSVQAARCLAVTTALMIPAGMVTLLPFLSPFNNHGELLPWPSAVFFAGVLVPLIAAGAASGVFARSLLPNDGSGLIAGGLLLIPILWHRLELSQPEEIFTTASRSLGLLVPASLLLSDALVCLLAAAFLLGLATLTVRRVHPATPLRQVDPVKMSLLPSARLTMGYLGRTLRFPLATLVSASGLIAAGSLAVATYATMKTVEDFRPEWALMAEPSGSRGGEVLPPRILHRRIEIAPDPLAAHRVELTVRAAADADQELAAVTFGPTVDLVRIERVGGGVVQIIPAAASPGTHAYVLRLDPALRPDSSTVLVFHLVPKPSARRLWAWTRHPVYASFQRLPTWYGEGVALDYTFENFAVTEQPAPFEISLPDVRPRRWFAGAAETRTGDREQVVHSRLPDLPRGLFAAELETVPAPEGALDVRFVVFPEHKSLAEGLQVAYERRFERLRRAFGDPAAPLVFYEVPQAAPRDPLAISSATLDRLDDVLKKYDDPDQPTAGLFDEAFARMHLGAVTRLFESNFSGFEHPELLRDAWIEYLHSMAFGAGQTRHLARRGRDFVFVPWEWQHGEGRFPFDLTPQQEPGFRGPLLTSARPRNLVAVPPQRLLAFHHMLRGVLGDPGYAEFLRALIDDNRGKTLTLESVIRAAEKTAGRELGWFFDQWLIEGVVPRYGLENAQVVLAENLQTRELEYTIRVVLTNTQDGRMPVPVVLKTESDEIRREFEIGAGERIPITFVSRERPISIQADPHGWIVQLPEFDEQAKRPLHPQVLLKTVKEL